MDLIALVDGHPWIVSSEFENFISFLCTKFAVFGSKGFDTRDWITLPDDINLDFNKVVDVFLFRSLWDETSKVHSKGVRAFSICHKSFDILYMLLGSCLDMLLSISNADLSSC